MPGAFSINAEDVRLDANPAIEVNAGGFRIKVAGHVERVAGGLRLATTAVDGTQGLGGGGAAALSLLLDPSMEFNANKLRSKIKASEGIGADGAGYFVDKTQGFSWTGLHAFGATVPTISADPAAANEIARKGYVDAQINVAKYNFDVKDSVRLGTVAALPAFTRSVVGGRTRLTANASGALSVDGVTAANNDRIGIIKETGATKKWNGVYTVVDKGSAGTPWIMDRAADADAAAEFNPGLFFSVDEGTIASSRWVMNSVAPFTLDTDDVSFSRFDAGTIQAGAGLTRTGDTIDLICSDTSLTVGTDAVTVNPGDGIEISSGVRVKLAANPGIARGAGGLNVLEDANGGILRDGNGIGVKIDAGASGQLSKGSAGARVATGGVGLPSKSIEETFAASAFAFGSGISTKTVSQTPDTHANVLQGQALTKSGLDVMKRVAIAPAASGEWRLNGTTLEIFGDVTASGDQYRVRYSQAV